MHICCPCCCLWPRPHSSCCWAWPSCCHDAATLSVLRCLALQPDALHMGPPATKKPSPSLLSSLLYCWDCIYQQDCYEATAVPQGLLQGRCQPSGFLMLAAMEGDWLAAGAPSTVLGRASQLLTRKLLRRPRGDNQPAAQGHQQAADTVTALSARCINSGVECRCVLLCARESVTTSDTPASLTCRTYTLASSSITCSRPAPGALIAPPALANAVFR